MILFALLYKIDSAEIFLSNVGKQMLKEAAKLLSKYKQEQEIKKLYCLNKLVPRPRISTANKTQGVLSSDEIK